jgi:hypothetical protein
LFVTYALIHPEVQFILSNPPRPKLQSQQVQSTLVLLD